MSTTPPSSGAPAQCEEDNNFDRESISSNEDGIVVERRKVGKTANCQDEKAGKAKDIFVHL